MNIKFTAQQKIEELEKHIAKKKKELAEWRKQLAPTEVKNYTFKNWNGEEVSLKDCFGDKNELVLVYNMGKSCKYCTLWGDNYNGIQKPLNDRAAFVVVSPDAPEIQKEFAKSRAWNFQMLSHEGTSFIDDMNMRSESGTPQPGVSTFTLNDGKILHHNRTYFGPGDNFCNMWDFIDMLPSGVNGWVPKYDYE